MNDTAPDARPGKFSAADERSPNISERDLYAAFAHQDS